MTHTKGNCILIHGQSIVHVVGNINTICISSSIAHHILYGRKFPKQNTSPKKYEIKKNIAYFKISLRHIKDNNVVVLFT